MKHIALAASTALIASFAHAAQDTNLTSENGFYALGSLGKARFDLSNDGFDSAIKSMGGAVRRSSSSAGTVYKVNVGYNFNKFFAVEGGYVKLGKAPYNTSVKGGQVSSSVKASGIHVAALGILPVNEQFSVFGKLGLIRSTVHQQLDASGPGQQVSGSNTYHRVGGNWGVGASVKISKPLALRVEAEQFFRLEGLHNKSSGLKVNLLTAGVQYSF